MHISERISRNQLSSISTYTQKLQAGPGSFSLNITIKRKRKKKKKKVGGGGFTVNGGDSGDVSASISLR
jgi:hypothetical protein